MIFFIGQNFQYSTKIRIIIHFYYALLQLFAIAYAVAKRWIKEKYARNALSAWKTICNDYICEGFLCQVCIGTGIQDSEEGYLERPRVDGENHGIGLLLKSGLQIIEMKQYFNNK